MTSQDIQRKIDSLKNQFSFTSIVTEDKNNSNVWYISLDPVDIGWEPDRGYIADFRRQYGYGPDSSDMYYDYNPTLANALYTAIESLFDTKKFTIDDWSISTEYQYIEFTLIQIDDSCIDTIDTNTTPNTDKLFPTISVQAFYNNKQYQKTIEEKPNMVGEDIRDILKITFANFMDKAGIYFCCTLNDHNYLGYHTTTGIDMEFDELFEMFKNKSIFESIIKQIALQIPYDTTVIYNDVEKSDGLIIKFTRDQLAINNKVAVSTIQEIKSILEQYSNNIRYSIQPKADFINRAGDVGPQYLQIVIHPNIEKILNF